MPDHFSTLSEVRRPWLEPELIKEKFHSLSGKVHPDKIHSAGATEKALAAKAFAELNAAYQCLADPKLRLLHLLELERGEKPKDIQEIPAGLADWFVEIARVCREADGFLAEKGAVTSPLLQVQYFQRGQEWIEKLNTLQKRFNAMRGRLMEELKALDVQWMNADAEGRRRLWPKLEEFYRLFGYFNRWSNQIQERVARLGF